MSINGRNHLFMIYIRLLPLLLAPFSVGIFAQDGFSQIITVAHDNRRFAFHCDGSADSSEVNVMLQTASGERPIFKQTLDKFDDCSQASWLAEKINRVGSPTLVLLNPGRSGLNAQYSAFLISGESVALAGYLPVTADKVSDSEYRSYSSEKGSVWERTDSLLRGKFRVTNELQLVRRGSVCVNKTGEILAAATCDAKNLVARPEKPICIKYISHKGNLVPTSSCARLTAQF
ncbi:hypothetical protein [Paraburkholderia sediminicola]|uniref:hypothetical protein n=1 Tax=Paraburkholderia sediminicola TaxID=458836 RepID=UPI0038BAFF65